MADLYRKRPLTVEVMGPLSPDNLYTVAEWCGARVAPTNPFDGVDGLVLIPTLEGLMTASVGDYVIREVKGEFYPCKPDIFARTYEPVDGKPVGTCCVERPCGNYDGRAVINHLHDAVERLRAALALACGLLSTYEDHSMFHPEALVLQFMEEARRG